VIRPVSDKQYLRITQRWNQDASTVAHYALVENAWKATARRSKAQGVDNSAAPTESTAKR
jgi:hypothetical protein